MAEREPERAQHEAEREAVLAALRRALGLEMSREELMVELFGVVEVGERAEPEPEGSVRVEQAGKPRRG